MRTYSVYMNNVAVTGAITLVQVKAGTSSTLTVLRAWCSQSNLTVSGQQRIEIVRKSAAATVTAFTLLGAWDPGDAASNMSSGTTATGTNASGEGTDGDILVPDVFNVLNGWLWVPTPEERIIVAPGGILGLKLPTAPGSSMTTTAGFLLGEVG